MIEHGNVVPPLKKQLSASDKSLPKVTQKASVQKALLQETVAKKASADSQSNQQALSADKVNNSNSRSNTRQASVDTQLSSNNVRTTAYAERNIAQSPALVSMNNEPVPHKRRRRQPTVVDKTSNTEQINPVEKVNAKAFDSTEKTNARYVKKAPKSVTQSTDKVINKAQKPAKASTAKPTRTSQVAKPTVASNINDNKGPVPSKRRRRQPSVNDV